MKAIRSLSSIALVSCITFSSAAAMSKSTEHISNQSPSAQSEAMLIAGFNPFRVIRDAGKTIETIDRIQDRNRRRRESAQKRKEREARREQYRLLLIQRQQELAEARRQATEQQRLEAERRRQYFENLTPAQRQAYLADQQVRRSQSDAVAGLLLTTVAAVWLNSLFSGSGSNSDDGERRAYMCTVGYDADGKPQVASMNLTKQEAMSQSMCN